MGLLPSRQSLQHYISLTKPGVLFGNVITGVAGFLFAAAHIRHFNLPLFLATIGGMTLIIGAACALNNVLDRDIDKIMQRTKRRAVASGKLAALSAMVFSLTLGLLGTLILALWTSWLVTFIGVAGFVIYVWLYGAFSKRRSIHGTLVGSISGAMPILAGYVSAAGRLDTGALLVFLLLFFWQFPEFYSIAIYRRDEYAAAQVPVMTVVKGIASTKLQIFAYTLLFVATSLWLTPLGYTGYSYFGVMLLSGAYYIWLGAKGLGAKDSDAWARKMFHTSLNMLLLLSAMLPLGALLP